MDSALEVDGKRASDISDSIETAIREGRLTSGAQLPTVRALADRLEVSPSTVSAAYRYLRQRGVISTHGRGGTRVHSRPPVEARRERHHDPSVRDLRGLETEPELGQIMRDALSDLTERPLTGDEHALENLLGKSFSADGLDAEQVLALGSPREALARVLESHLLPGDRVGIEAPSSSHITDVLSLNGLEAVPIDIDHEGPLASSLTSVLPRVSAVILTPRAQAPTTATVTPARASELRVALRGRPEVLAIEWDFHGPLSGAAYEPIVDPDRSRWATIRSFEGMLGGHASVAGLAGDPVTLARVRGRQVLSGSEVSLLIRRLAVDVLAHPGTPRRAEGLARQHGSRRVVLLAALRNRGIIAAGQTGPTIWIPTHNQAVTAIVMEGKGWLVGQAERPTSHCPQGIWVAVDSVDSTSAGRFADDLLEVLAAL
ncbi:MAG: DNA-binding transcriptional MocR family regulator [Candidatus Poriferisodalaceae bacterium]|jgi:DNA-binding transcriptional MocR family regulator